MNLVYGEIVALRATKTDLRGKVRIGGALKEVSLDLLTAPQTGDKVLLCEGIALAKVDPPHTEEQNHVPGHTR
jgi:hydrogenase maturation factor